MTAPALMYLNGATEGTTQWKAETIQLVNWGGFQGHHQVAVSPTTTLFSGASGTGKSSLFDSYLALMMPQDTPFNGASNDATTGRARGKDQRSLVTYLKGKTDTSPDTGTGDRQDKVLRGANSSTWGAMAMTFVDDNQRRYTALRVYFVPRGVTDIAGTTMKLATRDGFLDLCDLESLAGGKFDKRALKARFPELNVFDTYTSFAQTLHTHLGIGVGGDGGKALRLLARIQAGHRVTSVDELYKSMVLEAPGTYAAADRAVGHFVDLEKSYEAMVTEGQKAEVLAGIPGLRTEYDTATENADMIDTFGVTRDGDTPFTLWCLRTQRELLDQAVDQNRASRRAAQAGFKAAREKEAELAKRIEAVRQLQRENQGDVLASLQAELDQLAIQREDTFARRDTFDQRTRAITTPIQSAQDLADAQAAADRFLKRFDHNVADLEARQNAIHAEQYPLFTQRKDLQEEQESLTGRDGLVPPRLHNARLMMAQAAGLTVDDLPFVAELLDLAPGQETWRKAAEVTLLSVARIMLVDKQHLDQFSRAIDHKVLPVRINFQGVALKPHQDFTGEPDRVSGKLLFKDSPFSNWVQQRVTERSTDALCVQEPSELGGGGARVTVNGQTRNGERGAHGELNTPNIIGFSNKARLAQISRDIQTITAALDAIAVRIAEVTTQIGGLRQLKDAHQYLRDITWTSIDVDAVDAQIGDRAAERDRILAASEPLRALMAEEDRLKPQVEDARREKFLAKEKVDSLDTDYAVLVDDQDQASDHLDRIDAAQAILLTDEGAAYLDEVYAGVSPARDLNAFKKGGVERLASQLTGQSRQKREDARKAAESLTTAFKAFQSHWPDPNLGVALASYQGYWEILNKILTAGLPVRREEWKRRLSEWSGQDLVPLNGAFETSVDDIEDRLAPVNDILSKLAFGAGRDRLRIALRRLHREDINTFRRELKFLSSGTTQDLTDQDAEIRFTRLRTFMNRIRKPEDAAKGTSPRDHLLDVRRHVEITAVREDTHGVEQCIYTYLGDKSGGETQELVAFIVGAALRFQLGDESRTRPRFAPVFLDEGFVKADAEFAGRAVSAWTGLGFQLIIGAPLDKVTALEPHMDLLLSTTKNTKGFSYITAMHAGTNMDLVG